MTFLGLGSGTVGWELEVLGRKARKKTERWLGNCDYTIFAVLFTIPHPYLPFMCVCMCLCDISAHRFSRMRHVLKGGFDSMYLR